MRSPAQAVISVFDPNMIAPVEHALTTGRFKADPTRSEHKVHLYDLWSTGLIRGMSNGQPFTQ